MSSLTLSASQLGHRVTKVEPQPGFRLLLEFDRYERRLFDLRTFTVPGGIFEALLGDDKLFREVRIQGRTVEWPNGATVDPDVLYHRSRAAR